MSCYTYPQWSTDTSLRDYDWPWYQVLCSAMYNLCANDTDENDKGNADDMYISCLTGPRPV